MRLFHTYIEVIEVRQHVLPLLITFVTNNYIVEPCCFVGLDFLELYALNDSL